MQKDLIFCMFPPDFFCLGKLSMQENTKRLLTAAITEITEAKRNVGTAWREIKQMELVLLRLSREHINPDS